MLHNNCVDCGAVILPKAKRCRPCNFLHRKAQNRGTVSFKCPMCQKVFYKVDRGDVKNRERVTCSKNCASAVLSIDKQVDPNDREIWTQARHRARGYIYKMGLKPTELPAEIFIVMVRSYVAKELMKRTVQNVK